MHRIGVDLEKLADGKPRPPDHAPDCPGAALRITRADFDELVKGREKFRSDRNLIPVDGYGNGRIWCSNPVAPIVHTTSGEPLFYGLCHSCHGLENDNRAALRQRAGAK